MRGVSVDLTLGTAKDGFGGQDALSDFEEVRGSKFDDVISGGILDEALRGEGGNDRLSGRDGNDRLSGGSGNDHLSGGDGNDYMSGGPGRDTLTGGSGEDVFVFNSKPNALTNVDKITDFTPGADLFYLDNARLKNIGFLRMSPSRTTFSISAKRPRMCSTGSFTTRRPARSITIRMARVRLLKSRLLLLPTRRLSIRQISS